MTFRKPVATTWKMNENQFCQMILSPWHMLSSIWVHFGLWRSIFIVEIWFSHIFPASPWSPYQSLFLRHEIEKGLRAVYSSIVLNLECENYKMIFDEIWWKVYLSVAWKGAHHHRTICFYQKVKILKVWQIVRRRRKSEEMLHPPSSLHHPPPHPPFFPLCSNDIEDTWSAA